MAKFIQIPTTVAGSPVILFNADTISAVSYLTATTFAVYAQSTLDLIIRYGLTFTNIQSLALHEFIQIS